MTDMTPLEHGYYASAAEDNAESSRNLTSASRARKAWSIFNWLLVALVIYIAIVQIAAAGGIR